MTAIPAAGGQWRWPFAGTIVRPILLQAGPTCTLRPIGSEGEAENDWILMDYADVVVHLMMPQVREFYSLERLWNDHLGKAVQHRRDTLSDS